MYLLLIPIHNFFFQFSSGSYKVCTVQVLFICLALSRDLRMCHCGQGTSRIFGPNAISPTVLSQWENGALLLASILTT